MERAVLFYINKEKRLFVFFLIWGLLLNALYAVNYKMHHDIFQMLERANKFVTEGVIIFHGNATSGAMGKIPGGLLSVLVGFPMKIWDSPYAALILLALLHVLALYFLLDLLRNYFSTSLLLLFTVLFWLTPWRVSEIYLWNPSYLFFATALHVWSAHKMYEAKSFWPSFWHLFSIIFAFQVHSSSIILVFISTLLFWRKAIKINWLGVSLAGLLGVGSLAPYAMALINNPEISPQMNDDRYFLFRGLLYVFPIFKSIWYWVRFSATIFPRHIFQQIEFSWAFSEQIQWIPQILWAIVKYFMGISTTLFSIYVNYQFLKKYKESFRIWKLDIKPGQDWLALYVALAFCSVLIAAALSPIDLIHWHLIIVFPIALFPMLFYLKRRKLKGPTKNFLTILFVYFTVYNVISALGSGKHSIDQDPQKDYIEHFYKDKK